ncbi:glycoside hydrolase family 71/99-like protein [Luteolibacter sp. SL250]|uniref:glycoside hydrolase family 71/99-like protein n=1 Tax=Luteolibacter sp. SL250 TaxID=2995170 RepID=UPI002270A694|nr:glycoside hydrolase family 71/99-like protein [Luteolibacter sp. SL250]WAC21117.1 glycoside hydrolase family 71/99-like protein [Luteolibacter sp. SL250]
MGVLLLGGAKAEVARTWDEAIARVTPIAGQKSGRSELTGLVVAGYQGWFAAEGDGSGLGWKHYGGKNLGPGNCSFDLWPDMSEMGDDERYPTAFRHEDGKVATLFSSYHPRTVDRHFKWMADYGIDGVMLQRFGVTLKSPQSYDFGTTVMRNVRNGASTHGRKWSVMYDLSGMKGEDVVPVIREDWNRLVEKGRILDDTGYLHHRGKPLVTIWGVGFNDNRAYGLEECARLVDFLKGEGNAVMLGVPYFWRDLGRDAIADPALLELLKKADIISPWAVGRYRGADAVAKSLPGRLAGDLAWTEENQLSYIPVIFPGFSWRNLEKGRGRDAPLNAIPREDGRFLWQQAVEAKKAGAGMIYVAMFDEVDESTAILKASNNPPVGDSGFVTYGEHPPDHYLWLTGEIGKMLRGPAATEYRMPER